MRIKCYNPKCLHEFEYTGKKHDDNDTITCTKCRHKLRLRKAKLRSEVTLPHALPHEVTSLPHEVKSISPLLHDGKIYPMGKIIEKKEPQIEEKESNNFGKEKKKIKLVKHHLGEVREIKRDLDIKELPFH